MREIEDLEVAFAANERHGTECHDYDNEEKDPPGYHGAVADPADARVCREEQLAVGSGRYFR